MSNEVSRSHVSTSPEMQEARDAMDAWIEEDAKEMEAKLNELVQELKDHPGSFLIFDRRTRKETWEAAREGERRGLLRSELVDIDEQESQYRIRLTL